MGFSGQSLLEFLICLPVVITVLAGAGSLFRTEWNRTRCAYQTFEAAHEALRVSNGVPLPFSVQVTRTAQGVEARGRCGEAVETVRLPDLEQAVWD